jgi:hypothetical protein
MLKTYEVTMTPKMTSYAGTFRDDARTFRVTARDRNEAISMIRRQRTSEEGRYGVPCSYSAKLAKEETAWYADPMDSGE